MSSGDPHGLTDVPDDSEVWILGPTISRAGVAELCGRLVTRRAQVARIVCDVTAITEPDATVLDGLARLQLAARRVGCRIEVRGAQDWLRDLIVFAGLERVLRGVEPVGQSEQREQPSRIEEVRDPFDPAG
jgi:hypothetical protein